MRNGFVGSFGCCCPSVPSAELVSGFLSLPLIGLSVLFQTFLKSCFFWLKQFYFWSLSRDWVFSKFD